MLQALYERDVVPDVLVRTSAGALNAAFVASRAQTPATAKALGCVWRDLTVRTSSSDLAVDSAGEAHHSRALGARQVGDVRLAVGADTEAVDESQVGASIG